MRRLFTAVVAICVSTAASAQTTQAVLGRCPLELGGAIKNCRVAFRTFGTLDSARRNAILIPTWFASRSYAWVPLLGPIVVVVTTGFFVIVVESLGAGASSSPSTSDSQSGHSFPEITIGDMVTASYRVATEHLKLPQLHAVVGISLGGLQAFEWGVSHPGYVRRIVAIAGGPRQAIYGRAMWELLARTAEDGLRGVVSLDSTATILARLFILAATSPAAANQREAAGYSPYLAEQARELRTVNLYEYAWQARAILRHDIARTFGGDLGQAARVWRARTLVVTASHDHSIDPQPAEAFARLVGADTHVIPSVAGHVAVFSDSVAQSVIRQFLKR
jgi:homoserine O-acetyltransferase